MTVNGSITLTSVNGTAQLVVTGTWIAVTDNGTWWMFSAGNLYFTGGSASNGEEFCVKFSVGGASGTSGTSGSSGTSGTSGYTSGLYLEANVTSRTSSVENPNTLSDGELIVQPHNTVTQDPLSISSNGLQQVGISVDAYLDTALTTLQTNALLPILSTIEDAANSGNYANGDTIATLSFRNISQTGSFTLGVVYIDTLINPWTGFWSFNSGFGAFTYLNGNGSTSSPYYTVDVNGDIGSGDV